MAKIYETVVIIDAMIPDEAIVSEFDAIVDKISEHGNLIKFDKWGRKKLAYEINGRTHGEYGVFYYEGSANVSALLEKGFRINENILRWLTIADNPVGVPEDREQEDSEIKTEETKEKSNEVSEGSNEEK